MHSDLRNLQNAQELLYNTGSVGRAGATPIPQYNYLTSGTITSSSPNIDLNFQASRGVEITLAPVPGGYTARADHRATTTYCTITVSDMTSTQSVVCTPTP
jgi:hypothetical protein